MKLSIIIPIYNTAKYLHRCINSCINQDVALNDFEIILINDGSTDESHSICEFYKTEYENIRYVQQENSGLSIVRNNGLDLANGEYIWFVDSDDWIKDNCLNSIFNYCNNNDLDVLRIGFKKIEESYTYLLNDAIQIQPLSIFTGKEIIKNNFVFGVPLYIFKKEYLKKNNLLFYSNIYHEDNEFTPRALFYAIKIGITNELFYYYYTRTDSITKEKNPKNCFDLLIVCKCLMNFSNKVDPDLQPYINNVISTSFNSSLAYSMDIDPKLKLTLKQQISLNKEIFTYMRKSKNIKFKIEGFIFSLFPNNVMDLYKLLKR